MIRSLILAVLLALPALADSLDSQCGPGGYGRPGCGVVLYPKGDTILTNTLRIGDCSPTTSRAGLTVRGWGRGYPNAQGNGQNLAATTFVWAGPPGGDVIHVCGGQGLVFERFAIRMNNAGNGLVLEGNNATSAGITGVLIDNVWISGSLQEGQRGIVLTGPRQNDQVDQIAIEHTHIDRVGVCIQSSTQQGVMNQATNLNCASTERGLIINSGAFTLHDSYLGQWGTSPTYMSFETTFTNDPPRTAGQLGVYDSHIEIAGGTAFRLHGGWYPFLLANTNILAYTDKPVTLIDSHNRRGGLTLLSNGFGRNGPGPSDSFKFFSDEKVVMLGNTDRTQKLLIHGNSPDACVGFHTCEASPIPVTCEFPDIDGSGTIGLGDVARVLACLSRALNDPRCDVNNSGSVTVADYACVQAARP